MHSNIVFKFPLNTKGKIETNIGNKMIMQIGLKNTKKKF